MSKVLSSLSPHHVRGDAARIVELEKRLALVSPGEDQHGITVSITLNFSASNLLQSANNPISLDDASGLCPEIDLRGIVNALAGPTGRRVQRVIVKQPAYLESLSVILSHTRKSTLQQFFVWKTVQSLGSGVETAALLPWERFLNENQGKVCRLADFGLC